MVDAQKYYHLEKINVEWCAQNNYYNLEKINVQWITTSKKKNVEWSGPLTTVSPKIHTTSKK